MREINQRKILNYENLIFNQVNGNIYAISTEQGFLCGYTFDLVNGVFLNDCVRYSAMGMTYDLKVVSLKITEERSIILTVRPMISGSSFNIDAQYLHFLTDMSGKAILN